MQVVRALHAWLASEPAPGATEVCAGCGSEHSVPAKPGQVQKAPVTGYTVLGRKHLVAAIESRVGRYGPLVPLVPLMVVLAGAAETGVSAELVAGVLNGGNNHHVLLRMEHSRADRDPSDWSAAWISSDALGGRAAGSQRWLGCRSDGVAGPGRCPLATAAVGTVVDVRAR